MMQDPRGPWRVYELQGGFNEVLESMEMKEGSIMVIVFHGGHVGNMRVLLGLLGSSRVHELKKRSMNVWLGSWVVNRLREGQ